MDRFAGKKLKLPQKNNFGKKTKTGTLSVERDVFRMTDLRTVALEPRYGAPGSILEP
jgi:hypothetical protein